MPHDPDGRLLTMRYTRLHTTADGESHFSEVEVELHSTDFAPPAPPIPVSAPIDADRVLFARLPAGFDGDPHPTPARQFWTQVSGTVEVSVSSGETRSFGPGSVLLLEDTTGRGHVTRVPGHLDVLGVLVQLPG